MRGKNHNIEMLRAISCVMVIVIHVANYFSRAYGNITQGEYIFATLCNALARVSVPCFLMISGALLLGRQDTIKQSLKRTFRLFVALLAWSVIYYLFNVYYMRTPVVLRDILEVPAEAHLWYLYALIPIYFALPLLQWVCGKMKPWMEITILCIYVSITVILTVSTALSKIYDFHTEWFLIGRNLFYVFAGHVLMKYKDKIKGKAKGWLFVYLASCVLNAFLTFVFSYITGKHVIFFFWYRSAFIMIGAICFFLYMIKREHAWQGKYLSTFCECSFGIYLMHILFLDIFKKHVEAQQVSAYWAIPILVASIGFITWGMVWILRRCQLGRKIT